jgi:uncharacterized membrane protein YsdA (DUF1294 family)
MRKRRSQKSADAPEPFRYRPTPPPPIPAPARPEVPSRRPEAASGRKPAGRPPRERGRPGALPVGGLSNAAAVAWFLLLVLPALALRRLSETADWRMLAGGTLLISLITWRLLRNDKEKARNGSWRTPESTLHLAELAGGWPASFLAQRRYRHKIAKQSYQFTFWGIVALHEFVAFDCLSGWRYCRGLLEWLRSLS